MNMFEHVPMSDVGSVHHVGYNLKQGAIPYHVTYSMTCYQLPTHPLEQTQVCENITFLPFRAVGMCGKMLSA